MFLAAPLASPVSRPVRNPMTFSAAGLARMPQQMTRRISWRLPGFDSAALISVTMTPHINERFPTYATYDGVSKVADWSS
jgi:hypothetical protein